METLLDALVREGEMAASGSSSSSSAVPTVSEAVAGDSYVEPTPKVTPIPKLMAPPIPKLADVVPKVSSLGASPKLLAPPMLKATPPVPAPPTNPKMTPSPLMSPPPKPGPKLPPMAESTGARAKLAPPPPVPPNLSAFALYCWG